MSGSTAGLASSTAFHTVTGRDDGIGKPPERFLRSAAEKFTDRYTSTAISKLVAVYVGFFFLSFFFPPFPFSHWTKIWDNHAGIAFIAALRRVDDKIGHSMALMFYASCQVVLLLSILSTGPPWRLSTMTRSIKIVPDTLPSDDVLVQRTGDLPLFFSFYFSHGTD